MNGLLVEPGDVAALAAALERVLGDRQLAERLSNAARSSVDPWLLTPQDYAERTRVLVEKVGHRDPESKPRVLLVGRTRYQFPLNPSLRPKFDALDGVARPARARELRSAARAVTTSSC